MAHSAEPSSSSRLSNICSSYGSDTGPSLEVICLHKLSSNLEQLLIESGCDYSDADIIVEGISVGVHRCILASRSKFFNELFKKEKGSSEKEGKLKYCMNDLLPYGKVGYEAFNIFLTYIYTGKLMPCPREVSTCVYNECAHDACRPAINFAVELMYASSIFKIPELVSLFQRRLLDFAGKARVEDVIPILMVAFHCQLSQLVTQCVDRVAKSDLNQISIEKELPNELSEKVKLLRNPQKDVEDDASVMDALHLKNITRIHKALDSYDVELVKLLLNESDITLDGANALHYAAAYCDPKVVSELLNLGLADVNLRNSRGYTVLHIAAMHKEPSIILSLLTKGACASDLTFDGESCIGICRRLTRPKDYYAKTEKGKETNKDRICIDVLEREMQRNPVARDASMSSQTMSNNLRVKLLHLEIRVAYARLFFPSEAKLATDVAHAETTSEFAGISASKDSKGNLRVVDFNETPTMQNERLQFRMALFMKIVETGRRYFPHCSEVIDKFTESDLSYLEKGTIEEQGIKRKRFRELQDDLCKALAKDNAEFSRTGIQSSSLKDSVHYKARKVGKNIGSSRPTVG